MSDNINQGWWIGIMAGRRTCGGAEGKKKKEKNLDGPIAD
eukprot:CAMPEP_0172552156 /NCGR_PEP_ID=MMETSP1067-20121228/43658_1 /TAXON_ID=265564 ORGANISM="Thalassiosira punctigera, Strain Tpunct2005C2" /NCGR_SAMPLE_ID=MMETSP1067 /ASSEMBLY_ACC=CAM_ASM_000444 /LENGTH=39 /DNA_ID= /DNA_START= /DNA_END= /DNA_ORIENTATION=